jgi:hypothetical protein
VKLLSSRLGNAEGVEVLGKGSVAPELRPEICSHDEELSGSLPLLLESDDVEVSFHRKAAVQTWNTFCANSRSETFSASSDPATAAAFMARSLNSTILSWTSR